MFDRRLVPSAIIITIALVLLAVISQFYVRNLRGIWPLLKDPPVVIGDDPQPSAPSKPTDQPADGGFVSAGQPLNYQLVMPEGIAIELFAKNLPGARVLAFDGFGNLWVSQTGEGQVSMVEISDGRAHSQAAIFRNLNNPHGLAFDPDNDALLYIAEENKISRVTVYSDGGLEKIVDLPDDGGHYTRTIGFGPDERLYVSVGSSCNVCHEQDERRAAISVMNKDGSDFALFAHGLRNAVFFTWHPQTAEMWATDMGRDLLGDDTPPEEINIVREGGNYGWPICYGQNIHDTDFDKNTYIRNPCMEPFETPSYVDMPAHNAPLGLAFIPQSWPAEYRDDLIVALHGSWNRSVPDGYKLRRIKLNAQGVVESQGDFISGWLNTDGVVGRPVDVIVGPDDALYVSDDRAGVIYRVYPKS